MGKREEQSQERRAQILMIGLDEFIEKGYFGTSTREISRIAGISSGLMFHYFTGKQALYEALIEIGCSELSLDVWEDESPLLFLTQKVQEMIQMIITNPVAAKMYLFMGDAAYNAAKISAQAGEMLSSHDIIKQSIPLIERGQKLGEIREGDPRILSSAFWCSVQGVAESIAKNDFMKESLDTERLPKAEWIIDIIRNTKQEGKNGQSANTEGF